jgi:CubicO group peptidase (beta-lactamase class C family)
MQAFDQILLDLMDSYGVPGIALAVSRDGSKIIERGYGLLDRDDPASQATAQSSFRIASCSKPITAMAVLKLLGQHVFTLGTPIFALLSPTFPLLPGKTAAVGVAQITVRQLLNHSAGWSDTAFDPMFAVVTIAQSVAGAWPPPANQTQIIQTMWSQSLVAAPGSQYAYANFHYCLLGRLLEHFLGNYALYVGEIILQPFGMASTFLATHLLTDRRPGEARYHPYPGEPQVNSVFTPGKVDVPYGGFDIENMDSHGGWVASPIDLVAFMNGVFRSGFIDTTLITAAGNTVQVPNTNNLSYGLGWNVRAVTGGFTYFHLGSLPGTSSVMVRTRWPSGADVCWAAVMNMCSGGQTAGPAAAGGAFVSVFGQQQHFAFRDSNGTVWDAWFDGATSAWQLQQLNIDLNPNPTGLTGAPSAVSDPFVSVFGEQHHFAYLALAGAIWDVWFDSGSGLWKAQQINAGPVSVTAGTPAAGRPFVCVFGRQQHFAYRDAAGAIQDAWFDDATGAWQLQEINQGAASRTGAPGAAGDPYVSVFGQQQHFAYRGVDGALWDALFDGATSLWTAQLIAGGAGSRTAGPPPASDPFVSVFGQQQHFIYADAFGVLWDAWFDGATSAWQLQQINAGGVSDAPLLGATAGAVAFVASFQQQQHFAFLDAGGVVWDVFYDGGQNRWSRQQLNLKALTNGPAAAGPPFISFFGQQQHFAYPDAVGNIWDAWFDETNATWHVQQINGQNTTILSGALDAAMWAAMDTISANLASFPAIP